MQSPRISPRISPHWTLAILLAAGMALTIWLVFILRFNLQSSPSWQFVPYLLALAFPTAACSAIGTLPSFNWMGRLQFLLPLSVLLIPVAFLTWEWTQSGPYTSIRSDQYLKPVLQASAVSAMGLAVLGILQAALMSILLTGHQMKWHWITRFPRADYFLPLPPSPGNGDLTKDTGSQDQSKQPEESS